MFSARRRTVEEEMKMAGKTCIELGWLVQDRAGWLVQDRAGWRRFVGALCSSGSEEG